MRILKRMAVLAFAVLALSGCTKSSISDETPAVMDENVGAGDEEIDPAKFEGDDDDETLPRDQNILIDDEPFEESMYDWDQVRHDATEVFTNTENYPQSVAFDFTADEEALAIALNWTVKADTSEAQAMEYAAELVKLFNDMVAVQSLEIENSSATSFGTLWDTFALNVKITEDGGAAILDKSYKAGEAIDLKGAESSTEAGPEEVPEDVPKKV